MISTNKSLFISILLCSQSRPCAGDDNLYLRGLAGGRIHVDNDSDDIDNVQGLTIPRRVVLIAGPHKTGSSSIQNNMYQWMNSDMDTFKKEPHPYFKNWAWPGPAKMFESANSFKYMHGKIFYPFGEALNSCRIKASREIAKHHLKCEDILELYRNEFRKYWQKGYSLAIGTEAFDFIGADHLPTEIDHLLEQMPWSNNKGNNGSEGGMVKDHNRDIITVVVKYRSPRVKHLISWWHECCMNRMTFYEFMEEEVSNSRETVSRIIDSLQLVERFLDAHLNVVLIDISGVIDGGYDLSNVVACDVMNIPCTSNKLIIGQTEEVPLIKNRKSGGDMGPVTPNDLDEMEKIIRRRDCSFKDLLGHSKLRILYPKDVADVLESCEEDEGISRIEMERQLLNVIKPAEQESKESKNY